jgi:hypothetical protein
VEKEEKMIEINFTSLGGNEMGKGIEHNLNKFDASPLRGE